MLGFGLGLSRQRSADTALDLIQDYLDRVSADGGTALLTKAEIEGLLPTDWQNASFLNIPSARKAGTLYSIIGSDFTITRPSNATEVNGSGLIESVAASIPRIDFIGGGGKFLSEGERTNNLSYSQDLPSSFTATGGLLTSNTTISPDGTTSADTFTPDGTEKGSRIQIVNFNLTANTYVSSVFAKAGVNDTIAIQFEFFSGGAGTQLSFFNLSSGTTPTSGAKIENYGNGWFRCTSAPYTISAGDTSGRLYINSTPSDTVQLWPTAAESNGQSVILWGAQAEIGSSHTSYIPTTTTAITRSKDLASITSAGAQIGQVNSTVFCQFNASNFGELRTALTLDGASGSLKIQKLANNDIRVRLLDGATIIFSVVISGSLTGVQKLAVSYSNAGYISSLNGATGASGTLGGSQPTDLTDITLGADSDNSLHWNDTIASVALWKEAKDQTALNAMTA